MPKMDEEQFTLITGQMQLLGGLIEDHDFTAYIGAINHSETIGFLFVAPMMYQKATPRTQVMKKMAGALREFQEAWKELNEVIEKQEAQGG